MILDISHVATPILTDSISRLFLGIWTDRYGGRWVFGVLMLTTAACVYLLTFANSYLMLLEGALGVGLGRFIYRWRDLHRSLVPFVALTFILGFFVSLGKAAVYKH